MAGSGLIQTCTEMAKFVSVLSGKFVSNTVDEKSPRSIALMTDRNLEHLLCIFLFFNHSHDKQDV